MKNWSLIDLLNSGCDLVDQGEGFWLTLARDVRKAALYVIQEESLF